MQLLTVLTVAVGLLIAVLGVVAGSIVRRSLRRRAVDVPDGPRPHVADDTADVAICVVCGTLNEAGYRVCRHCGWTIDDSP